MIILFVSLQWAESEWILFFIHLMTAACLSAYLGCPRTWGEPYAHSVSPCLVWLCPLGPYGSVRHLSGDTRENRAFWCLESRGEGRRTRVPWEAQPQGPNLFPGPYLSRFFHHPNALQTSIQAFSMCALGRDLSIANLKLQFKKNKICRRSILLNY